MKTADVVTPYKVDLHGAVVKNSCDQRIERRAEIDTATSTMFAVPCWWSWKTTILTQLDDESDGIGMSSACGSG